jgi:hypothetical protein
MDFQQKKIDNMKKQNKKHLSQEVYLRTPNPMLNPGFTPRICYIKRGVNPGLAPGFSVLRFGRRQACTRNCYFAFPPLWGCTVIVESLRMRGNNFPTYQTETHSCMDNWHPGIVGPGSITCLVHCAHC